MKKIIITLLLATTSIVAANAQDYPYDYTHATQAYTYLGAGATEILGNTGWDDTTVVFSLPIDFKYQGLQVTDWTMDTYGGLYPNGMNMDLDIPAIMGVFSDYIDNGSSKISYEVSGTTGSRIAKIEYRNMGFFGGTETDTANFQIWLYEGINKIEYHVGPSHADPSLFNVDTGDNTCFVGLNFHLDVGGSLLFQVIHDNNGANTDTTLAVTSGADPEILLSLMYGPNYPSASNVFIFAPKPGVGIQPVISRVAALFPNPVSDKVTLRLKTVPQADAALALYTITGQKVWSQEVRKTDTEIAMGQLPKGLYLLSYEAGGKREIFRLIRK